ncbi:hypothetical protein BXZ70DRAFT_1002308 [Cristinia sonorae]|uniref:Uncharacterized protein n=1 Tax=Cristinia sonorae TaxID=1940300 RepID=A0A8K0XLF7_9AGAR|nr:hypothetical protein BXZ70DRAFT_1002308 [Cristinia sonorae]
MELMPSLSRSSGLDKDGDSFKNLRTQEQYRDFIQTKVRNRELEVRWPIQSGADLTVVDVKQRDEVEANLLILFRKLREGLLATSRRDPFALEVYETSLHLSILFNSPSQTTSIISHLLPQAYLSPSTSSASPPPLPSSASTSVLLSCLHFLVTAYPSQSRYAEHLASLGSTFLPPTAPHRQWLNDLTRTLRLRNYAKLEMLTNQDALSKLIPLNGSSKFPSSRNLAHDALEAIVEALRAKARETTWSVIRSAYRELHCPSSQVLGPSASDTTDSKNTPSPLAVENSFWLCRSLALHSLVEDGSGGKGEGGTITATTTRVDVVAAWLTQRSTAGEVRLKEGTSDRWIVCKVLPAKG